MAERHGAGKGRARIAILAPSDLGRADGNSVRAKSVAKILGSRYATSVLTARSSEGEGAAPPGVRVDQFFTLEKDTFTHPLKLAAANLRLVLALVRGRFDLVYAQGLMLVPGLVVGARLAGSKLILEAHSLAHLETAQLSLVQPIFYLTLESFAGRAASAVVALSGKTAGFYKRLGARVYFVPVFVDPRLFRPAPRTRNGSKKVGLVGPFEGVFNGGQLEFLSDNVGRFDRAIRFVLLGRLRDGQVPPNAAPLGFLPDDAYASELASLDALLVPARVGTYGPKNKILEAMSAGVPVFSTPQGALGLDFARPGEELVVADIGTLARALNSGVFQTGAMERMAASAREMVLRHYALEGRSKEVLEAVGEVLDRA